MTMASEGFNTPELKVVKLRQLGVGSYGSVFVAMYGDVKCAAKFMHQALFQFTPERKSPMVEQFEKECEILREIRHPCIIQFLDKVKDPESGLPILLMELLDENLTTFLEKSEHPPLYHLQVNICHDIAMALSYLHSMRCIHRDVSSNNVLLVAGSCKAKLSDFGVSTLTKRAEQVMTMCPGSLVYMPPEGNTSEPKYTDKMDIFSFGVIGIQIATCHFPRPGDQYQSISAPFSLSSSYQTVMVPVPEVERRQNHISLIPTEHVLKETFLSCLKNEPTERPSAHRLCEVLMRHKESTAYIESMQSFKLQDSSNLQSKCESMSARIQELDGFRNRLQEELERSQTAHVQLRGSMEVLSRQNSSLREEADRLRASQSSQASSGTKRGGLLSFFSRSQTVTEELEQRLRQTEQEKRQADEERNIACRQRDEAVADAREARREVVAIRDDLEWKEDRLREKEQQHQGALRKYDELEVEYSRKCNLLKEANDRIDLKTEKLDSIAEDLRKSRDEIHRLRNHSREQKTMLEEAQMELEAQRRVAKHQQNPDSDQESLQTIMEYIRQTSKEQISRLNQQLSERESELRASQQRIADLELELSLLQRKSDSTEDAQASGSEPSNDDCRMCEKSILSELSLTVKECQHVLCKSCLIDVIKCKEDDSHASCPVRFDLSVCSSVITETEIQSILDHEDLEALVSRHSSEEPDSTSMLPCFDTSCQGRWPSNGEMLEFCCPECQMINCLVCNEIHKDGQRKCESSQVLPKSAAAEYSDRYDLCPLEDMTDTQTESVHPDLSPVELPSNSERNHSWVPLPSTVTLSSTDTVELTDQVDASCPVPSQSQQDSMPMSSFESMESTNDTHGTLALSSGSFSAYNTMFPSVTVQPDPVGQGSSETLDSPSDMSSEVLKSFYPAVTRNKTTEVQSEQSSEGTDSKQTTGGETNFAPSNSADIERDMSTDEKHYLRKENASNVNIQYNENFANNDMERPPLPPTQTTSSSRPSLKLPLHRTESPSQLVHTMSPIVEQPTARDGFFEQRETKPAAAPGPNADNYGDQEPKPPNSRSVTDKAPLYPYQSADDYQHHRGHEQSRPSTEFSQNEPPPVGSRPGDYGRSQSTQERSNHEKIQDPRVVQSLHSRRSDDAEQRDEAYHSRLVFHRTPDYRDYPPRGPPPTPSTHRPISGNWTAPVRPYADPYGYPQLGYPSRDHWERDHWGRPGYDYRNHPDFQHPNPYRSSPYSQGGQYASHGHPPPNHPDQHYYHRDGRRHVHGYTAPHPLVHDDGYRPSDVHPSAYSDGRQPHYAQDGFDPHPYPSQQPPANHPPPQPYSHEPHSDVHHVHPYRIRPTTRVHTPAEGSHEWEHKYESYPGHHEKKSFKTFPSIQTDDKSLVDSLQSSDRKPDEFLAVLMQQKHVEDVNSPWKAIFTICMRTPCCVKPLQDLLRETCGEHFEVALFCIKFQEGVTLVIPEDEVHQQGYSVTPDVRPCMIAKNEVFPAGELNTAVKATATYPPRRTLNIKPLHDTPSQRRCDLEVRVTLEGIEMCDNQREFILRSPTTVSSPRRMEPAPTLQPSGDHQLKSFIERKPDTNTVVKMIGPSLGQNWGDFGQALGVPYHEIEMMNSTNTTLRYHGLCKVVEYWITHCPDATWETIIKTLNGMNEIQLAQYVLENLRKMSLEGHSL